MNTKELFFVRRVPTVSHYRQPLRKPAVNYSRREHVKLYRRMTRGDKLILDGNIMIDHPVNEVMKWSFIVWSILQFSV